MKKFLLPVFILFVGYSVYGQFNMSNNVLSQGDIDFLSRRLGKIKKSPLNTRASTTQIELDYPRTDSILQGKALTGNLVEKTFYWEVMSSRIDTASLPSTPGNFNIKGLVQAFDDLVYIDANDNVLTLDPTRCTVTIDSINPFFAQFTKGGAGNDTLIFDVYEDSFRYSVNPSCNFSVQLSGVKRVGGDTLIVVNATDIDNYMFRKKITLSKGAGFLFKVSMLGDINSKFRAYASYTENCNDSAFARISRVGYGFTSCIINPSSGSPYRFSIWSTNDLNTTLACKKFYTQNWYIFPFLTVSIDSPTVIVSNNQTFSTSCKDATVQLYANASGFSGTNLSYAWSPSTGLSATNISNPVATVGSSTTVYTVTVTGTNGSNTVTVTGTTSVVSNSFTVTISASKTNLSTCKDSAILTASGTGYTYSWSAGANTKAITVKNAGTYTVTASNTASCTASATSTITNSFVPYTISSFDTPSVNCAGKVLGNYAVPNPRAGWNFNWVSGSTSMGTGASVSYTFSAKGTKSITVTADSAGCTATKSQNVYVRDNNGKGDCLSLTTMNLADNITIFPNPVRNGLINIKNESLTPVNVKVTDMLGKTVSVDNVSGSRTNQIDLSRVNNGVYFIEVEGKADRVVRKIVVDKQ